jgi:murein DD-endopeptidase MepM/ murein hydrolase activator NlpD
VTKLGWGILIALVLVVGGFLSMLSFGDGSGGGGVGERLRRSIPFRAAPAALTIPVAGVAPAAIVDSWGDAREGGARDHHGTDIMAPGGTPVLAAADGTVEKLFDSRLGGTTLYIRSPDRRWVYYYAHLSDYAPGIAEGVAVQAGQPIAYVGDTGDAGPGNTHLHFGVQRMRAGEGWWQGRDVNPYPLLAGTTGGR